MTIKELQEKRAALVEEMRTITSAAEKRAEKDRQRSALVFILASACALRRNPKRHFGAKRLTEHMADLQEVYELLDGYGEDAAWKCVQILEDAGVNMDEWKKMLRELFKEEE